MSRLPADLVARVRALVARDRLDAALDLVVQTPELATSELDRLALLRAQFVELERAYRRRSIRRASYLQDRTRLAEAILAAAAGRHADPSQPRVFLSYSHADSEAALAVKAVLERASIAVRIDVTAIHAGQDIRAFILESIRQTDATVCIVSEQSLLSGWVVTETTLALADANLWGKRLFVACFLDHAFLDPAFRLRATAQIDERIQKLDALIIETMAQRLDTDDLNAEKSQLYQLRNQLGAVLQRLRESLCVDIRGSALARNTDLLLRTLCAAAAADNDKSPA